MDRYMKNLLANRQDVVIVSDSARVHYNEGSGFLYADNSSAEMVVPESKADARWTCKSQSPCTEDSTKTKDSPIEQPPKRKPSKSSSRIRRKVKSSSKSNKAKKQEESLSSPPQDADKAQQIIGLVQSLAFRAATAVSKVKKQRESENVAVSRE